MGVVANPAETLRQLNESKEMLRKAKEDHQLSQEAKKIPRKHTFSKLPGFHGRQVEQALLRKILSNQPKMTVIYGATSVGKTALLREVLATDDFYVVKFDLRISGFANLRSLYITLCEQFESFFEEMHDEEMDKSKLMFKHLLLQLYEKEKPEAGGYEVTVADIACLMESFQSGLLKYWEYKPKSAAEKQGTADEEVKKDSQSRQVDATHKQRYESDAEMAHNKSNSAPVHAKGVFKQRPVVILFDEAHKLGALVNDELSMKVLLDSLLVLTKQDRLCHVLFATSDSFFQHFLRSMNVGHHSQILTIGDPNKIDTHNYFREQVMAQVPTELRTRLRFDEVWDAFGGKLSHVNDYVSAWINDDGEMTPYTSAVFIQAYTLLQFHLTHSKFETYSPLSTATAGADDDKDQARFTPQHLIEVMRRLIQPPYSLPYFQLCRDIGTDEVDSMIKTRILELRWTKTVVPEEDGVERQWSADGIERPIVLPMTRIIRKAMEVIIAEEADLARRQPLIQDKEKSSESTEQQERRKDQDDEDEDSKA